MLGLRVTPEMKQRLDAAAQQSGRSQSQEAEFRLERSFERQDLLPELLTAACGSKEVAGLVLLLAHVLQDAGFLRYLAERDWHAVLAEGRGAWITDFAAYTQAAEAVAHVLEALRPETTAGTSYSPSNVGKVIAEQRLATLHALKNTCGSSDDAPDPRFLGFAMMVADLLGPIVTRITLTHPDQDHADTLYKDVETKVRWRRNADMMHAQPTRAAKAMVSAPTQPAGQSGRRERKP
jgi:hypothetical protein